MKTIKLYIFLFGINGILIGCNSKFSIENEISVSEKEIYQIVNHVCNELDRNTEREGQTYFYLLENNSIYFDETKKVRTSLNLYFLKDDIPFIVKQIKSNDSFKFKNSFLNSKQVLSTKVISQLIEESKNSKYSFDELYENKFRKKLFYSISVPLFSVDIKTVYVEVNRIHDGFSLLLKKVNGKWQSEVLNV